MRSSTHATLGCATLLLLAAAARAGEPERLLVEVPPDVRALEPGERLDVVQVVGVDADGARVGFPGRSPTLTASAGTVEPVEPPYRFAYTAPARIDGPLTVTLEAELPDRPGVRGTLRLDVLPPGPYVRLRVEAGAERVAWGEELEVQVRGETRDGKLVAVADRRIEVAVDGPGELTFVRLGHYRFRAPAAPAEDGRSEATIRAHVARDAAVHGRLALLLGTARLGRTEPEAGNEPVPDGDEDEGGAARDTKGVDWPGGRLRLTSWRVRTGEDDAKGRRMRRMPEPGGELAAREPLQRLRIVVTADAVTGARAEARLGPAPGRAAESNAVELATKRNKGGALVLLLDARPPADGTELRVALVLEREGAAPLRDVLVLRRRPERDEGR